MRFKFAVQCIALAATAFIGVSPAQQPPPGARPGGPPGGGMASMFGAAGKIEKVADNLYLIPGGGGNSVVWVTSKGVLLVDTKTPGQGQAILDQIKTVTDKPVLYVINTHYHFDHSGSDGFFVPPAELIGQEGLPALLNMQSSQPGPGGPQPAAPEVKKTYKDKLTLFSGDDAVDLYNFGPAHTRADTLVVFRKARVMATGDVFASKGQPIIDTRGGGSGINYPAFIEKAVKTIKNVDKVIPGHSGVASWQDFVDYGEFNQLELDAARAGLKAGKTPVEALQAFKASLPAKFKGYQVGKGMMTGEGGNFEPIYAELKAAK